MSGVVDLGDLCRQMTPRMAEGVYVYCTFSDFRLPGGLIAARVVPEGPELIVTNGRVTVPEIDGYCILELDKEEEK